MRLDGGTRCALIGPNGSGKTTLLRLVAGIFQPARGDISVKGRIASVIDPMCHVEPLLTGRRNTASLLHLHGVGRERIDELVDFVGTDSGLGKQFEDRVGTYSAGMQWKLALWTLLAVHPDVMVIDEGIATLDEESRTTFRNRLEEVLSDSGILILATQSPMITRQFCRQRLKFIDGAVTGPETFIN